MTPLHPPHPLPVLAWRVSANTTEDVFLKTVVVQVYATLDDEFVKAFLEGPHVKQECLETVRCRSCQSRGARGA